MIFLVALLAVVPALLGVLADRIVRGCLRAAPPAVTAVLLAGFALSVSLSTGLLLCLVAYLGTLELLPALHPADWSAPYLRKTLPVPVLLAAGAGFLAIALLARAFRQLGRVVRAARRTTSAASLFPVTEGIAVVDDDAVHAYAVPGRSARVVVSTGLLRRLDGPQRRALLAHEAAHLRHRHHLYAQAGRLAEAANPLLRPVVRAIDAAIERWADAEAVRAVGDPAVVARALGLAALAAPGQRSYGGPELAAAGSDVVERVRELLEPPQRRGSAALPVVAATALCWLCCGAVVGYAYYVVELAEAFYRSAR